MYKIFIVFISLFLLGGVEDKIGPLKDIINLVDFFLKYKLSDFN